MWKNVGNILKTVISWKHIVLGVRGENTIVLFRNFFYSIIVYALFKNWCKNMENNLVFNGNMKQLNCKNMVIQEMEYCKLILKASKPLIKKIVNLWSMYIIQINEEYIPVRADIGPMSAQTM